MGCRFDPHWSYRGLECLRVENEHVAVEVLPRARREDLPVHR